jgi:hypothetical protein
MTASAETNVMSDELTDALNGFANSSSLAEVWDSSRRLMIDKRRAAVADNPLLMRGLERLREWAVEGPEIDRLIAIDLLVRIPASIRKVEKFAQSLRAEALHQPLPPLSTISEKKGLPTSAKPAEIRENVAKALNQATGEWVLPYVIRALAEEDRSQRCRNALSRQVAQRISFVDQWFDSLLKEPALRDLAEKQGIDNSVTRLRDIALALGETIRMQRYRLQISVSSGRLLSELARAVGPDQAQDHLSGRV